MNNPAKKMADILSHKGLLSAKDIVNGDYQVTDISRRNQNYRVECGEGIGYFIKQVKSADPQATASFQCEASVHWLAQNDPDFAPLNNLSPRCRGYDPQQNLLVIDLLNDAQTLSEVLQIGLTDLQATQLGQQLAITHWHTGRQTLQTKKPSPFSRKIPWTLSMQDLPVAQLSALSEGCRQLISMVQSTPHLFALLTDIKNAWQVTTFIHGDLKPDNCLILKDVAQAPSSVHFIDWELADFGDPAWDLASILQGIWIPSLLQQGLVDDALSFTYPTQHLIHIMIQAYLTRSAIPPEHRQGMQVRVVQFAAARMVQSAYEMLHASSSMTTQALLVLQAASHIYVNALTIAATMSARS